MLRHLQKSGLRVHFDYEAWNGQRAAELDRECANIPFWDDYDVIYGHFPITRYQGSNYRYIALLRDPYERALSNYKFHRQEALRNPGKSDLYSRIGRWIALGEMSFLEYVALAPNMRNVFRDFMHYWRPESFSLIGRQEQYDVFLSGLSEKLGVPFTNDIRERHSEDKVDVPQYDADRVRNLLFEEYQWFRQMLSYAGQEVAA